MNSPFPGMDPFIEINPRWEGIHGWFIRKLAELSMPRARERGYWIDVERTVYQREPSGEFVLIGEPDSLAGVEANGAAPSDGAPISDGASQAGVTLVEPKAIHEIVLDPEQLQRVKQDYLVVRELGRFSRVVAVVEVLSPANKRGNYVERYREKRRRFLASPAHFMEIDFLRDGTNISRDAFPELPAAPYFVFRARKTGVGRLEEGLPLQLQDPLPTIGLPLAPNAVDLPLDLGAAFRAAFDLSIRAGSIDYAGEQIPPPALIQDDAQWVKRTLHEKGFHRK